MAENHPFESERFPRSNKYHPGWVVASASGGPNPPWLTEWLVEEMNLLPGMRVLDLGCGRAMSSIFLRREFGVQVWAADLWFSATENLQRIRDAGVEDGVFPLQVDARSLPFARDFFDVILGIDSFMYFGTDDFYLSNLARYVRPGGIVGIALSGLTGEFENGVPAHLRDWWSPELWCLHSASWWGRHWEKSGILDLELADTMPEGWRLWLDWQRTIAPGNEKEIQAVEADQGRNLGFVRVFGRRRNGVPLEDPVLSIPAQYLRQPLLRDG